MGKLFSIIFVLLNFVATAQKNIQVKSPDQKIIFSITPINTSIYYSISYNNKKVVDKSQLSLQFSDGDFSNQLIISKPTTRTAIEDYSLVIGKTKNIQEQFQEAIIPIEQVITHRKINIVVRVFNDGIGFRYEFPDSKDAHNIILTEENTQFNFSSSTIVRTLFLPNYTSSHEGLYKTISLDSLPENTLMDLPTLFETPEHVFVGVSESNLLNYAGMYLCKEKGVLRSKLSPLPNQTEIKVKANLPHHSPWRVFLISDRMGALIESNIITNLAEPQKINNTNWIKPGKTTFPWWNGNVVPDTINAPGNNFVTNQYYIDFCARNNIQYHSVVEYGLHEWYTNDGAGFVPGPNVDVTKPVPGLDMQQVCDYAKSKNVDIRVWVYWTALYKNLDRNLAQFEKWGIKGMMVDFMDRDDQEMVNIQTEILEKSAEHHIHVQFHGAYKPTGLNRTYPNEFTREGTLNYEVNKWNKLITPDHDISMPFTRMLAGSTDYHLGGFRAVPDSLFRVQYTRPLMLGTRCHMLGMYVVLENYLGMVCDYPEAYENQPGFEFIKEVPTVWDETKVLASKLNEYIVIARKKNNNWYIGAINNHQSREIDLPFSFLEEGDFKAEIFSDANDVSIDPNHITKQIKTIHKNETLHLRLENGGGFAIAIKK